MCEYICVFVCKYFIVNIVLKCVSVEVVDGWELRYYHLTDSHIGKTLLSKAIDTSLIGCCVYVLHEYTQQG